MAAESVQGGVELADQGLEGDSKLTDGTSLVQVVQIVLQEGDGGHPPEEGVELDQEDVQGVVGGKSGRRSVHDRLQPFLGWPLHKAGCVHHHREVVEVGLLVAPKKLNQF